MKLEEWGDFHNATGWSGYVPTAAYFVVVFLQIAEQRMDFMRRCIQMVDGEILAGDASCKVPKLVKLGDGGQYKKFLYSVMNGHGQIVGFWFVDQDSAECLKPMFDEVNARFVKHGGTPPILAFGDNCCGADRSMFQGSFPSLKGGTVAQEQRAAAATARVSNLPNASLLNLDFDTTATIIRTWDGAGELGNRLLLEPAVTVIGLDAEWTPQAQGSRVDVLQLAVPGIDGAKAQVFILHLCHKDMQPPNGERYDGGSGVPEGQWGT